MTGSLAVVKFLVAKGASVAIADLFGRTPVAYCKVALLIDSCPYLKDDDTKALLLAKIPK
jgi:hypothetical protein